MPKPKSANTAGLLGIFAGAAGGHDWYLGRTMRALIHIGISVLAIICICVGSAIYHGNSLSVISGIVSPATQTWLNIGLAIFVGNVIWSEVEGFILIIQGEAGLARRGLAVVDPTARPTLSPKTKKKLIFGSLIGVGAVALIGIICLIVSLVTRVDYGETYRTAKELHPYLRDIYDGTQCRNVITYADSTAIPTKTYEKYLAECRELIDGDNGLIDKLGQTAGIRRDAELSSLYDDFKRAYTSAVPSFSELEQALKAYQSFHEFYLAAKRLNTKSTQKQIAAAANFLAESGNEDLKAYGKTWQSAFENYITAYQDYQADETADRNSEVYKAMIKARSTYEDVNSDMPNLSKVTGLGITSGATTMYRAFRKLNDQIRDAYAKHYNHNSGDCSESSNGSVYCP